MSNSNPLHTMIEDALELEEIDLNIYRCESKKLWRPIDSRGVFGGQVIGLSLSAASKTVDPKFRLHSFHCYFLLPGDNSTSIVCHVERIRDGRSYVTRRVEAYQKGKVMFTGVASFQLPEPSLLEHQFGMPAVPPPESIRTREERLKSLLTNPNIPVKYHPSIKMRIEEKVPIDLRRINPKSMGTEDQPRQMVWMKAIGKLPDDLAFHQCVAAYCSDNYLLNTSLLIHNLQKSKKQLTMIASLDHTIWFHADFRADEWLLYEMESPRTVAGRGFALGRIFTRDGKLVASTAQEGVIRVNSKL